VQQFKTEVSLEKLNANGTAIDAAIVVDCSTIDRIGKYAEEIVGLPTAVIDHHAAGVPFGEVRYIEAEAPSVTYLIQKLIEYAGEMPTQREAELLLFGLCTDTGFFRHLESDTGDVFAACGRLVAAGASPKETFAWMFGNRTHDSRRLLGKLLERTERRYDDRLLVTWEGWEELREFGKQQRDSDSLYQLLQTTRGCEVVALVRQESEGLCSVGLRSTGPIDVGSIAKEFGGGGHHGASGFDRPGRAVDVASEVVDYFGRIFK
jgi:phosphoesterase RecJ-like protein